MTITLPLAVTVLTGLAFGYHQAQRARNTITHRPENVTAININTFVSTITTSMGLMVSFVVLGVYMRLTFERSVPISEGAQFFGSLLSVSLAAPLGAALQRFRSRKILRQPQAPATFDEALQRTPAILRHLRELERTKKLGKDDARYLLSPVLANEQSVRGFFIALTSIEEAANIPPECVILELRIAPPMVQNVLVRNIAMSTAQTELLNRESNLSMDAFKAGIVRDRVLLIACTIGSYCLNEEITKLAAALRRENTDYSAFLERMKYDPDQLKAIFNQLLLAQQRVQTSVERLFAQ